MMTFLFSDQSGSPEITIMIVDVKSGCAWRAFKGAKQVYDSSIGDGFINRESATRSAQSWLDAYLAQKRK